MDQSSNQSSQNNRDYAQMCHDAYYIYVEYVERCISVLGVVFNLINISIFLDKRISTATNRTVNKSNNHMYKYLLIKSVCDCIFLFQNVLHSMTECDECANSLFKVLSSIYVLKIFNLIISYYLSFVCQLCSMLCDVAATFDRYFLITRGLQQNKATRNSYKYVISLIIFYSATFYIYKPFQVHIVQDISPDSKGYLTYSLNQSEFGGTSLSSALDIVHSLVRDAICVSMLFLLNLLILVELKKSWINKRKLIRNNSSSRDTEETARTRETSKTSNTITIQSQHSNELRLTLMVVLIGVISIIGHLPILFYYIFQDYDPISNNYCFFTIKSSFYYLSFFVNIFFYYFFNRNYRRIFKRFLGARSRSCYLYAK